MARVKIPRLPCVLLAHWEVKCAVKLRAAAKDGSGPARAKSPADMAPILCALLRWTSLATSGKGLTELTTVSFVVFLTNVNGDRFDATVTVNRPFWNTSPEERDSVGETEWRPKMGDTSAPVAWDDNEESPPVLAIVDGFISASLTKALSVRTSRGFSNTSIAVFDIGRRPTSLRIGLTWQPGSDKTKASSSVGLPICDTHAECESALRQPRVAHGWSPSPSLASSLISSQPSFGPDEWAPLSIRGPSSVTEIGCGSSRSLASARE